MTDSVKDWADNNLSAEQMLERMQMLRYKVHERRIGEVWKDFTASGFEPILIKGWAAAQFYPQPYRREFGDIDLLIAPERYAAARIFLQNSGKSRQPVDLHRGARHHDTLDFGELFSASVRVPCGTVGVVRVPRAEDHLRILCVHWLTDGGVDRGRLWDIYYAVDRRSADFDWERLLNVVSPTRRRWIVCTIGLARKYLALSLENTPIDEEAGRLPRWLTETVEREWRSGGRLQPLPFDYDGDRKKFLRQMSRALFTGAGEDRRALGRQIKMRLAPNPIYATVDAEGEFEGRRRTLYRLKNFFRRLSKLGMKKE